MGHSVALTWFGSFAAVVGRSVSVSGTSSLSCPLDDRAPFPSFLLLFPSLAHSERGGRDAAGYYTVSLRAVPGLEARRFTTLRRVARDWGAKGRCWRPSSLKCRSPERHLHRRSPDHQSGAPTSSDRTPRTRGTQPLGRSP